MIGSSTNSLKRFWMALCSKLGEGPHWGTGPWGSFIVPLGPLSACIDLLFTKRKENYTRTLSLDFKVTGSEIIFMIFRKLIS